MPKFSLISILSPTILCAFIMAPAVVVGMYHARGVDASATFVILRFLYTWAFIGYWFEGDSRKHAFKWFFDIGFFLCFAWPLFIPYYLLKTRGMRALWTGLAFIALYCGGYVIGLLL